MQEVAPARRAELERKRQEIVLKREKLEATARRQAAAQSAARQQTISSLNKRLADIQAMQTVCVQRNSILIQDCKKLQTEAASICPSMSASSTLLQHEKKRFADFVSSTQRRLASAQGQPIVQQADLQYVRPMPKEEAGRPPQHASDRDHEVSTQNAAALERLLHSLSAGEASSSSNIRQQEALRQQLAAAAALSPPKPVGTGREQDGDTKMREGEAEVERRREEDRRRELEREEEKQRLKLQEDEGRRKREEEERRREERDREERDRESQREKERQEAKRLEEERAESVRKEKEAEETRRKSQEQEEDKTRKEEERKREEEARKMGVDAEAERQAGERKQEGQARQDGDREKEEREKKEREGEERRKAERETEERETEERARKEREKEEKEKEEKEREERIREERARAERAREEREREERRKEEARREAEAEAERARREREEEEEKQAARSEPKAMTNEEAERAISSAFDGSERIWTKFLRHLAAQLEGASKEGASGGVSGAMYHVQRAACSPVALAEVLNELVCNANAVSKVGVATAAGAFSEIVRRFPNGVVPQDFIRNFLWNASPDAYAEERLLSFLSEGQAEMWRAVRRHMDRMAPAVSPDVFADAMAQVLLGTAKPTAASKAKVADFVLAVHRGPAANLKQPPLPSDDEFDDGEAGAAAQAASATTAVNLKPAPVKKASSLKPSLVTTGGAKGDAKAGGSRLSPGISSSSSSSKGMLTGPGGAWKKSGKGLGGGLTSLVGSSAALLSNLDVSKSSEDDEDDDSSEVLSKTSGSAASSNFLRPKPSLQLNSLLSKHQFTAASATPMEGEDEFDF